MLYAAFFLEANAILKGFQSFFSQLSSRYKQLYFFLIENTVY